MSTEVSKYRTQVEAAFRDVLFNNLLVIREREREFEVSAHVLYTK
jgi:hypothetical protein